MRYLLIVLICGNLYSQEIDSGVFMIRKFQIKQAIAFYERNLKKPPVDKDLKGEFIYNLACSYSLSGDTKNTYLNLLKSFKTSAFNKEFFYTDADFYFMTKEKGWRNFVLKHSARVGYDSTKNNDSLFYNLSEIAINDQALYKEVDYTEKKFGRSCKQAKHLWHIKDSLNLQNLSKIKNYYNSGINVFSSKAVGKIFANKCFLVIQHSDTASIRMFLPIIKKLYLDGETKGENYALLYDRNSLYINKGVQYYGTQVNPMDNTVYPIKDEKNVDKRRTELGMIPLKDYLLEFGIIYNPKRKR